MKYKFEFYPYEIIKEKDGYYLYNGITSSLYELDEVSKDILLNKNYCNQEEYNNSIEFMKSNFIIKTDENIEILEKVYDEVGNSRLRVNPTNLTLMVSQDCNLRCTYCYGGDGEYNNKGFMNFEIAKKAVDYLIKHTEDNKLGICFFGGEPLLNFKLIKQVVKYAKEIESRSKKKFSFSMTTNGTIMNEEIEKFICDNRFSVTISIDGDEAVHNKNRFYSNKNGCYKDVIKNINRLLKKNAVVARATISMDNMDLEKNISHLVNLGFRKVAWAPAINMMNNESYNLMIKKQEEVITKVEKLINEGEYDIALKYGNIIKMLKKIKGDGIRVKACGTGVNMIAVGIDGDIYPCHRFIGEESRKIGNVLEERLCENKEFYESIDIRFNQKCQKCICKNVCLGGCPQESYLFNKNLLLPEEASCRANRETLIQVIKMYINLNEEAKEKLL